jgi:septum formation protein
VTDPTIYLASRSPRRRELLAQIGVPFAELRLREAAGREPDVVEGPQAGEDARRYVRRIAREKAQTAWARMRARGWTPRPVLAADTEVVLDGVVFGKPADADDAVAMMTRLSGRTHAVLSGVAVRWEGRTVAALSTSRVTLRELAPVEIERYVATGEPLDKAGAYAVQGRAASFVSRIEGSYSGVMGLPLYETAQALAGLGFPVL